MTESSPETRDSLLVRLADAGDQQAWAEFVALYQPMIYRLGRRHGLQHADAWNLVQDVLCKVQARVPQWQMGQARGSFRRWLATVARNAAIDALRRIRPDAPRGGTTIREQLDQIAGSGDSWSVALDRELERQAFRMAARRIRSEFTDSTWRAFWETAVEGRSCSDVARRLEKRVGAIYTSRSRVLQRLREELESDSFWQLVVTPESRNTDHDI